MAPSIHEGTLNTSVALWFQNHWVEPYEGWMNPTQWLQDYATAVRATGGDTSVMANYLPVMLMPTVMNWFTSLAPNSIGSWE